MKNIFKKTALALSVGLLSLSGSAVFAATATKDVVKDSAITAIEKSIGETIGKNKDFKLESITPVEGFPGLYEVIHNRKNIFYVNSAGTHIVDGSIIKLDGFENITADKKAALSMINFADLPKNPIILKEGKGENKLAVFADPNCVHCKNLEPELQKLKNVTISLYILPILSEDSQNKAENILCSKKPGEAWSKWMLEGKTPEEKTCTTGAKTINTHLNFAKEYGISGTPTLVFANGEVAQGSFPAAKIQDYFKTLKEREAEAKAKTPAKK